MITPLIRKYSDRFLSKWIVLLYDLAVVLVAYLFVQLIWQNVEIQLALPKYSLATALLCLAVYLVAFLSYRSYSSILRFTGLDDAMRLFKAMSFGLLILLTGHLLTFNSGWLADLFPPFAVILFHYLLSLFVLIGSRFIIRSLYGIIIRTEQKKKMRVVIFGAGASGMLTRNALLKDRYINYDIRCFIDDNPSKLHKRIEGVPVLSPELVLVEKYIRENRIDQMIISIQQLNLDYRRSIIETGLGLHLDVKVVPPIDNWINGELSSGQLRKVRIEELLEREPITLDNKNIRQEVEDKVVLVTGAAGSIGSEICRQLLHYDVAMVVMLDQAESPLYDLQFELNNTVSISQKPSRTAYIVADVNDRDRMEHIFSDFRPDIIFHAAAYKHVPLMEEHPYESVRVNVHGTRLLADLSLKYDVIKFVMISTDKAVNPTNVMGASKRIAEMYIQQLSNGRTQFITTRFGNVLGSNGSVIPLFRKQIEQGGPVTLTHRDIIRYFMTIPEACNLVLEAGAIAKGGEIFVFDMGEPVRIYDLATKMIQLSGLEPGRDIEIREIGLRPGEKLFEELLADDENNLPTHHPQILVANTRDFETGKLDSQLDQLQALIQKGDDFALVEKMKEIVPEFKSNNSVFSKLDRIGGGEKVVVKID
jgi:FlaA1/EpsC-like NDP-sugar epimerase